MSPSTVGTDDDSIDGLLSNARKESGKGSHMKGRHRKSGKGRQKKSGKGHIINILFGYLSFCVFSVSFVICIPIHSATISSFSFCSKHEQSSCL